jgi:hypothetical protein
MDNRHLTTCHEDGTISYWSVYSQRWYRRANSISDAELAAMGVYRRQRVRRHLVRSELRARNVKWA